jgi:hypothetical protein
MFALSMGVATWVFGYKLLRLIHPRRKPSPLDTGSIQKSGHDERASDTPSSTRVDTGRPSSRP